jgi:hypothetical protein
VDEEEQEGEEDKKEEFICMSCASRILYSYIAIFCT